MPNVLDFWTHAQAALCPLRIPDNVSKTSMSVLLFMGCMSLPKAGTGLALTIRGLVRWIESDMLCFPRFSHLSNMFGCNFHRE